MVDLTDFIVVRESIDKPNVEETLPIRDLMPRGRGQNITVAELAEVMQLDSGTYVPVFTDTTNIDSSTGRGEAKWIRIGSTVSVMGNVTVDATAADTTTEMGISLPVPSVFTSSYNLAGAIHDEALTDTAGGIAGDVTPDNRAQAIWSPETAGSQDYVFNFQYRIL